MLSAKAVYPESTPRYADFASRRSTVHSTNGIVACTQPLAAAAGQRILREGGNAAVCQVFHWETDRELMMILLRMLL
jgi:gamma-glutamyltranspeptidase/glutathione hydrolase